MYAYQSDIERLEKRVEIIERALGKNLDYAKLDLEKERKLACKLGNHKWERIEYDLLQGKWGVDKCKFCPKRRNWSYNMGNYSEHIE